MVQKFGGKKNHLWIKKKKKIALVIENSHIQLVAKKKVLIDSQKICHLGRNQIDNHHYYQKQTNH